MLVKCSSGSLHLRKQCQTSPIRVPVHLPTRCTKLVVRAEPPQQQQQAPPKKEDDLPPWARKEKERQLQAEAGFSLPWPLYLLFSGFTAIAAVGSIFEFTAGNPIAGVIAKDSPLWAPILLTFAVTGFPTAGFLFLQGVNKFNEEAERQDKLDGYL